MPKLSRASARVAKTTESSRKPAKLTHFTQSQGGRVTLRLTGVKRARKVTLEPGIGDVIADLRRVGKCSFAVPVGRPLRSLARRSRRAVAQGYAIAIISHSFSPEGSA